MMTNNYYFPRGGLEDSVRNTGFPVLIVNIDNRHASEPLREKEPMNVTNQQKENASVYCLCPRCRSMFSDTNRYSISRVDPYQFEKDSCTFCQTGYGYDYHVIPKLPSIRRIGGYYG